MHLVFCFPYRGVGGVSLLFLRFAQHLATSNPELKLSVVDYADGFMAKNLTDLRVELITYHEDKSVPLPENAIVIMQTITPWSIFPSLRFNDSNRLLFWNCFPYNAVPRMPGLDRLIQPRPWLHRFFLATLLSPFRRQSRGYVKTALANDGLVFMDRPNVDVTEWALGFEVKDPKFLPVSIAKFLESPTPSKASSPLRAAWIGRIADFKAPILGYTIERLSEAARKERSPVEFTIIGDGKEHLGLEQYIHDFFKIQHTPFLSPPEVEEFLASKCDVLFAMGTSALEGARMGVPTVLLDFTYGEVPNGYRFRYLFEAKQFSLGDLIDQKRIIGGGALAEEILAQVRENRAELGERSRQYFLAHHAIDAVGRKLVDLASRSQLTYSHLREKRLLDRPLAYRLLLRLREMK